MMMQRGGGADDKGQVATHPTNHCVPRTCSYTPCMECTMKNTSASTAKCWLSHRMEKVLIGFTNSW